MNTIRRQIAGALAASVCALVLAASAAATGVPIGGFLPMVGIALTNEFKDDFTPYAEPSLQPSGIMLGRGGTPFYDVALLDTGAAVSVLTAQAHFDFMMNGPYPGEPDGFRGTEEIQIGGATGTFFADINDPVGLYVGGLQNRTGTDPLTLANSSLRGQTNTSLITLPPESDLPNIVGLPYASQYATYVRNDQPQIFTLNGRTVRTPHIEFLPLGSGGQGIARRAPMSLNPGSSFTQPPSWLYNLESFDIDNPHENPWLPTLIQGAMFLNVNVANDGNQLSDFQFFFDTGADVTVLSELNAYSRLGLDPENPMFTVAVLGSGGTLLEVPGYFVDQFTIQAVGGGGNLTLNNVPIVVLDVTNPADPGNVVEGIVGTNLLAGRNVVIDPNPSTGGGGVGPSLYIGNPVTNEKNWVSTATSAAWTTADNWSGGTLSNTLSVVNVRHVAGGDQSAVVSADLTVWELNVSGNASQSMKVRVESGVRLTTFAGVSIETGGIVEMNDGSLDTQWVDIVGGTLGGSGLVTTGSGPVPGQVENRSGTVAPGIGVGSLHIEGRFANGHGGTLAIELGGLTAASQHDVVSVDGSVTLAGTLDVTLVNLGGGMFAPSAGNSFTILSATEGVGGAFDNLLLPAGYQWDIDYGANDVVLSVVGIGLAGDFNGDGTVDAADYVLWRKNGANQQEYLAWRSNLGASAAGGGSAAMSTAAVPEPVSMILVTIAACGMALQRQRLTRSARSGAWSGCGASSWS
jgi:hypothetical protein